MIDRAAYLVVAALLGGATLSACPSRDATPVAPSTSTRVQLVGCAPATPLPVAIDEGRPVRRRPAVVRRKLYVPSAPTSVVGTANVAAITNVLRSQRARLEACGLVHGATEGRLLVSFTIDHRGVVTAVNTARHAMGTCLERVIRTLRFTPARPGNVIKVTYPFVVSAVSSPRREDDDDDDDDDDRSEPQTAARTQGPWTPYGADPVLANPAVATVAHAAEAAMRGRLTAVEKCFTPASPTGSLRAMVALDGKGTPTVVRVGGLGDRIGERCVADALGSAQVVMPTDRPAEIACDLARGDAAAWRVDPAAGYEVVTVVGDAIRHGKTSLPEGDEPAPLPRGKTYLVLVDPEAPGAAVDAALRWTRASAATLVALRGSDGQPRWLGAGPSSADGADDDPAASVVSLTVERKLIAACVDTAMQIAPLANPRAVTALMDRIATRCRKRACVGTVDVSVEGALKASDLVDVVASARRAGVARLLLGGGPGCSVRPVEAP